MNILQLRLFAHQYHIGADKTDHQDLVKEIERKEGKFACFRVSSESFQEKYQCLWRNENKQAR